MIEGWQNLRFGAADVDGRFGAEDNLGLLTGEASHNLVDIDLDCAEAVDLAAAILPSTPMWSGRERRPRSHAWYAVTGELPDSRAYKDVDATRATLVEFRGNGRQTVVAPSIHPDGDTYLWEGLLEPTEVHGKDLLGRVRHLAAATILARHWPREKGSRHDISNALAGMLLRAGWSADRAVEFVVPIATAAGDEEAKERGAAIRATEKRLAKGGAATGRTALVQLLGHEVVDRVAEWLDLGDLTAFTASASSLDRPVTPWPAHLSDDAFQGLAGEFVNLIEEHTEADPAAILVQFLVAFGNCIGRRPHYLVEADQHYTNLFLGVVGATSKGRKGTSWGQVIRLLYPIEEPWVKGCVASGLSSGEGLIWSVHDEITRHEAIKRRGGEVVGYQDVVIEPAVSDKRLLAYQSELASVLRVLSRDGNTLSATVRDAWDTGNLRTLTKHSPARATGAHISIIGHVTKDELLRYLETTEVGNGFANRFLWICAKRARLLPDGGTPNEVSLKGLRARLELAIKAARGTFQMKREPEATELWRSVYPELSAGRPGMLGAVVSRAEAQVVRLSCIYALLDSSELICVRHLRSALAVWEYAEASARYVFGDTLGDPIADAILKGLRDNPTGLTRNELRDMLGRNQPANRIGRALAVLQEQGLTRFETEESGGRPAERWMAIQPHAVNAERPAGNRAFRVNRVDRGDDDTAPHIDGESDEVRL